MVIFMAGFVVIGAYVLTRSYAATDCSSYPAAPAGTASINLCPSSVDHTLPAKFWGYGFSQYYYNDLIQPGYQQLFRQVAPEVFRNQIGKGTNPGTPSSPNTLLKNMYSLAQTMKSQGLDLGEIVNLESGPTSLPTTVSPATISNYDQTGNRSPSNHGALVNWFMDGGVDVLGYEAYNEPANNERWYANTGTNGSRTQLDYNKAEAWAYVHQRQFADGVHQALSAKGRSVKVLGGVLGTGEGYGTGFAQQFYTGSGTIISDGGGWPWSTNNLANTTSGPIFDTYVFHPYPGNSDPQSGLNSLAYPTRTTNNLSSLLAFMETTRSYLNANGGSSKQLAFDEGGFDLGTNVDALTEGVYAVLTARNQAHWNVPYYTLWSANTNTVAGASIWPLFLTSDHVNFRNTIRSSAARDITGKFLHNYKKQLTGFNVATVGGSGMTPGGAYTNPVQRIQATAGVNSDGTKMAVLAVNMDLTNSQPFQVNLGTTATGPVTATYMTQTTAVGNMPTTSISATNTFTRTLEPGSEYLFEIPISGAPAPTVSLSALPATISAGGSSTLTWSSTNATSCSAAGGWTSSTATSGGQSVSPASTTSYSMTCSGAGGSASDSKIVTVTAPAYSINARSVAHTVDGNLSESDWNLSKTAAKTVSGSTTDTASWGMLWDSSYLYVGIKVLDSSLSTTAGFSPVNYWQNDSVEVYLDPNADGGTTYDSLDKQLAQVWNDSGLYGVSSATAGVLHAWAASSGGYSVEMAIPWSSLGVTPSSGISLGIDIGLNDSVGGSRVGQLMWSGTANDYQNPSGFGLANLNGAAPAKIGDVNNDGLVNGADLAYLAANYKTSNIAADLNGNGIVDAGDLSILLSHYGT